MSATRFYCTELGKRTCNSIPLAWHTFKTLYQAIKALRKLPISITTFYLPLTISLSLCLRANLLKPRPNPSPTPFHDHFTSTLPKRPHHRLPLPLPENPHPPTTSCNCPIQKFPPPPYPSSNKYGHTTPMSPPVFFRADLIKAAPHVLHGLGQLR